MASSLISFRILLLLFVASCHDSHETEEDDHDAHQLAISAKIEPRRVNENFNVTSNKDYSSAPPNPDITVLSQDYYLCLWSYVMKDDSNASKITYSNEIYSNLFSMSSGKSQVQSEYLLNRIRGYSQDTPSATALFNSSNHLTHQVAVVWESQIESESSSEVIDAVFGRIIKWSITRSDSVRYIRVTSPTSKEFQISSTSIDYLHHMNPDVVPIYNTGKFMVSWISRNEDNTNNMVFIRIYHNSGRPYSEQIQVHETDIYWKKHPRTIPMLHNLTLIAWLTQSAYHDLIVYGMVCDENGESVLVNNDQGRYPFLAIEDNTDHTIYDQTIPIMAHLHNDPHRDNNYFILGWNSIESEQSLNTLKAAVFVYNEDINAIQKVSELTDLLQSGYDYALFRIKDPVMENIMSDVYEYETGLNAKVAVCYTLQDLENERSDVHCQMIEIAIWDDRESVEAEIYLVSEITRINDDTDENDEHGFVAISSESILREQTNFTDTAEFVLAWGNSREGGYDVYTQILQVVDVVEAETQSTENEGILRSQINVIIFGVVVGLLCVVLLFCVGNHLWMKYKDRMRLKPRSRMQQLGDDSDEEDDDGVTGTAYQNETIGGHDDESDDDEDAAHLYTNKH